jgi:P-type Ca2+ transporter type 2C
LLRSPNVNAQRTTHTAKPGRPAEAWHALTVQETLTRLDADLTGLSDEEAARRLARHGPNRLAPPRPASALRILRDQLTSIVVFLLIAAAGVSLLLGDRLEAAAIAAVLVINTVLGFVTELRARRAMEALLQFEAPHASVVRGGHVRPVGTALLVPGDIVEIRAGQLVPADARVVEGYDLRSNEAALTGESLPISKHADAVLDLETPLADRRNMVYTGTTVAAGTARVVVTSTGGATELGRIGALVGAVPEERTPLERRLDALGRRLVWLALAVAAAVAGLGALQGAPLGLAVETAIALAVAAVPEALPAVATIALAVGLHRMARRQTLVRRLPAVEALGSTTVVCTDKTRTLTSGEMSVVHIWTPGGEFAFPPEDTTAVTVEEPVGRALEVGMLASRPQQRRADAARGAFADPVDAAFISVAERAGVLRERYAEPGPLLGVVPFSSERKLMAAFHRVDGSIVAFVKGAPRRVVALSDRIGDHGAPQLLDADGRERLLATNADLAARGLRVLGLAKGKAAAPTEAALHGLTFIGFVGIMDPPARGVRETIARLRAAGLRTIMITGDQRLTAEAIGRELGVLQTGAQVVDERELRKLSTGELQARLADVGAFSRVSPEDKLTIVSALQTRGEIVAMLGDGVNDAAALKKADVGVAMGIRGTDVAKEAAAIVLQDDRFETIGAAVEEGRIIYDNIRKFVFYLFSCNLAEILVLLVAGIAGFSMPLLPLQILWLNMVTDTFPALALAMEPGDPDVMSRPPRDPQEAVLSPAFFASIGVYGGLITASTLAAYVWALGHSEGRASTIAFMTLALAQVFHLGNARSTEPVLRPDRALANRFALGAVALAVLLQVAAVAVDPLARVLDVVPLTAREWVVVTALAAMPAVVGQAIRTLRLRRSG